MKSQLGRKCVKGKELRLQCEWANCDQIYNDLSDFYSHLYSHYDTSYAAEAIKNKDSTMSCLWNECLFVTSCHNDLLRHLYFHGYHTKVKWWGLLCCKKENLAECQSLQNRNIVPALPDGFRCDWTDCYMVFDIPDQFYMHVYNHALFADEERINSSVRGFKCWWDGCTYHYPTKDSDKVKIGKFKLREHLRTHTKERSYACPWCGNLYSNKTKFTDHLHRQMCIESHCFQCTHCSRTFATERLLKDHMRHHVNYYKCPKCAMTCPNPSGLKHHMKYKHSDERPFQCQYCEYRSKTAYDLQVHSSFHQSDLSYRCHVKGCDYSVRSLQNLRNHFRSKHLAGMGKCYSCHLCTKTYGVGYQLSNHLRTAHGFQWPPGHSRFKYKECEDGFFRLQTFRFESVELTEKLMVDDQSTSNRADNSSSEQQRPNRLKKYKTKKKRVNTKTSRSSSMTTRSASLLLHDTQNLNSLHNASKLNFRNSTRTRGSNKLKLKRIPLLNNQTTSTSSDSVCGMAEEKEPVAGCSNTSTWHQSTGNEEQALQAEFGGKLLHNSNAYQSIPVPPSAGPTSMLPTTTEGSTIPETESTNEINKASGDSSILTFTENLDAHEQHRLAAVPDGSIVRDEEGRCKVLLIDGEKYYLVKGSDADRLITYSLVDAKTYDQLLVSSS